jgi:hypothetical protein
LRDHVLVGGFAALVFIPALGAWGSLVFWLANVLIDLDHMLSFLCVTRFKVVNVRTMMKFYEKVFEQRNRPEFLTVELFHTIEFLLLFGLAVFLLIPSAVPIFYGFLFHVIVDFIHLARFRAFSKRSHTLIGYLLRRRRLRSHGKSPDIVFTEVFDTI